MAAKLSPEDVTTIRASHEPTRILSARHGVSITRIKELRHGLVTDPGGRPPGYPRTGGRQPGTPNKKTVYARQILEEHGANPVEMLAKTMKDEKNVPLDIRIDCAKALLPYVYPRLAAVELSGPNGGPVETENNVIIQALMNDDVVVARMESIIIEQTEPARRERELVLGYEVDSGA